MNIKEFAERIKTALSDALKKEVRIVTPLKINNTRLYGINIMEQNSNLSPIIYLESFYENFLNTGDWELTVSDMLAFYDDNKAKGSFEMEWFRDFSQVRKNVFYQLVNYDANEELLSTIPHARFLDLAKIYYVRCQTEGRSGNAQICNNHVKGWGITEDELMAAAEENTPRLYPVKLCPLLDIYGLGDDSGLLPGMSVPLFVLTNTERQNGAAAVCYEDVLDDFSRKVDDDLAVLPSSIHETILVPMQRHKGLDALKQMVYDINRTVLSRSDFLSDNVYIYNRRDKQLNVA